MKALATEKLAAATERLVDVSKQLVDVNAELATTSPAAAVVQKAVAEKDKELPFTRRMFGLFWRVVVASGVGAMVLALAVALALVAISFQTGFLDKVLPEQLKNIDVAVLADPINLAKQGPVALELIALVLAIMTMVLVLAKKPYGVVHAVMWGISLFVGFTNGWHIGTLTNEASLGVAYGAVSVLHPTLVHIYVLHFLVPLRSGATIEEAVREATGVIPRFFKRVATVAFQVLLAIGGVLLHPVRTAALVWERTDPAPTRERQLRAEERELAATLASKVRRMQLVANAKAALANPMPAVSTVPTITVLDEAAKPGRFWREWSWRKLFQWIPGVSKTDATPDFGISVHASVQSVHASVHGVQDSVQHRPDTTLPPINQDRQPGGVLTADPADGQRADHSSTVPDDSVQVDQLTAEFAAWLDQDENVARLLDTSVQEPEHGVQHGGVHAAEHGVQDSVQPSDGSVHGQRADERATPPTSVHADPHGVQPGSVQPGEPGAGDSVHGQRAQDSVQPANERAARRAEAERASMHGVQHGGVHGVQDHDQHAQHEGVHADPHAAVHAVQDAPHGSVQPPAERAHDDQHGRVPETPSESTETLRIEDALIIGEYFRRVHDGGNVDSPIDIARAIWEDERQARKKRSKVSRIVKACQAGEYPDPDPDYPNRVRAGQPGVASPRPEGDTAP